MQGFVVVSGLPASGKTTISTALAASLRLPLFDKDSFLETLFETEGVAGPARRRELSKRANAQFQQAAVAERAAVLTSWWRHPSSTADSGTPIEWLVRSSRVAVEVHCVCSAPVAAARFLARQRHPSHLDERWSLDKLLDMLEQQQRLGPLFPDKALTINTEQPVDMHDLVRTVEAKAHGGSRL
jgi:hypothetical protein